MCRCPRCGKGRLFNGFLTLAPRCEACGLDYSFADPADGPAFFVMIIMGIPAAAFGVWVEVTWEPSFWVHLLTSLPFMLLTCIPPIRPAKGMLVASQYFHKAEEGRFVVPQQAASEGIARLRPRRFRRLGKSARETWLPPALLQSTVEMFGGFGVRGMSGRAPTVPKTMTYQPDSLRLGEVRARPSETLTRTSNR